jgi:hypothetical protein
LSKKGHRRIQRLAAIPQTLCLILSLYFASFGKSRRAFAFMALAAFATSEVSSGA